LRGGKWLAEMTSQAGGLGILTMASWQRTKMLPLRSNIQKILALSAGKQESVTTTTPTCPVEIRFEFEFVFFLGKMIQNIAEAWK